MNINLREMLCGMVLVDMYTFKEQFFMYLECQKDASQVRSISVAQVINCFILQFWWATVYSFGKTIFFLMKDNYLNVLFGCTEEFNFDIN